MNEKIVRRAVQKVNGLNIFYRESDSGGQPMLCLHGKYGRGETWIDLMSRYGSSFRVIAPDQRGHGLSDKPIARYAGEDFADDAQQLLKAMGATPAIVVGHSIGGRNAAYLAALHPAEPALGPRVTVQAPRGKRQLSATIRDSADANCCGSLGPVRHSSTESVRNRGGRDSRFSTENAPPERIPRPHPTLREIAVAPGPRAGVCSSGRDVWLGGSPPQHLRKKRFASMLTLLTRAVVIVGLSINGVLLGCAGLMISPQQKAEMDAFAQAARAVVLERGMVIENDEVRAGVIYLLTTKPSTPVQISKNKWECEKKPDEYVAHMDGSHTKIERFCVWRGKTIKTFQDSVWEETGFEKSFVNLVVNGTNVQSIEYQFGNMYKLVRTDGLANQEYEKDWDRYSLDDARAVKFLNAVRTKMGKATCENKDQIYCP